MDNLPPIGTVSYLSPDPRRSRWTERRTSIQDETFDDARRQLGLLLEEEANAQAAQAEAQPPIPPIPNLPPAPPQPQPQPPIDEFADAEEDQGDNGDGNGNQDAERVYRIVTVAGTQIRIRDARLPPAQFQGTKTWNKEARARLTNEDRLRWQKYATKYVLSKNNQLRIFSLEIEDDKKLQHIQNFQLQLRLLRDHLIDADMYDVFNIVVPQDVMNHHGIRPVSHDLLLSYMKINLDVVSTSCSWYNTWSQDDYVKENMKYSFEFFRANTEESLFNKMLETYEQYPPQCQGGPLIAYLLLSKILLTTESAIEVMITKISKIKIRDIKGEGCGLSR